jgi:hypothetical protein
VRVLAMQGPAGESSVKLTESRGKSRAWEDDSLGVKVLAVATASE